MRYLLHLIIGLTLSLEATAQVTAQHTGNFEYATSVSGRQGVNCEYRYGNRTFWRMFVGTYVCPVTIQVE